MKRDSVNHAIRQFINGHFSLARKRQLQDDDPLLETGIVDSLGVLDIVGFIESQFGVTVSDDELVNEHFGTIGALTRYVEKKKTEVAQAQHT